MSASKKNYIQKHGWTVFLLAMVVLLGTSYVIVSPQKLYKPGDDIGYNLGVAGGLMMLTLLLYPLRKRVRFLENFGVLPKWFKWHMILGIAGPVTILLHSTYHIHSVNAGVAMVCMLLVSGSGVFGRVFYTKIHHGLYGRQTSLNEIDAEIDQVGDVKSVFSLAPEIERKLNEFRTKYERLAKAGRVGFIDFIQVGVQAVTLRRAAIKELHVVLQAQDAATRGNQAAYQQTISDYANAVRDVAQFHTYERLFSYWHIFHIPLVYMMVFSSIYHVYAVHAY